MTTVNDPNSCVESISLMDEVDKRVALVTVRLGEVQIRGISVWRSGNGRLRVHFPGYRLGAGWDDAIYVPDDRRSEVEADVIAAYRNAKAAAKKDQGKHPQDANVKLSRPPRVQIPQLELKKSPL